MIILTVVGFINASFSGPEQGPGHSVPVGYLKGGTIAEQNLDFNVTDTPGTASKFNVHFTTNNYYYVATYITYRRGFPV